MNSKCLLLRIEMPPVGRSVELPSFILNRDVLKGGSEGVDWMVSRPEMIPRKSCEEPEMDISANG